MNCKEQFNAISTASVLIGGKGTLCRGFFSKGNPLTGGQSTFCVWEEGCLGKKTNGLTAKKSRSESE